MGIFTPFGDYDSAFHLQAGISTEASGDDKTQGATLLPSQENNAPTGSVEAPRGILDKLLGIGGERYQTWPERMVRGAIDSMALPGDVLSGKVQPRSPQEIEKAFDLAGLMVGGPAPVASRMADGTLGSFAGVASKTIDRQALNQAQLMEAAGNHTDDIWMNTGFFRGADNRWRYEIPDENMSLKPQAFDEIKPSVQQADPNSPQGWQFSDNQGPGKLTLKPQSTDFFGKQQYVPLKDVIDHPELFKAYPELANTPVKPMPDFMVKDALGMVSGGELYLSPNTPNMLRQITMHEVQHLIQQKEGFARGGSPNMFIPKALPAAEENFNKVRANTEQELLDSGTIDQIGINRIKTAVKLDLMGEANPHLKNLLEEYKDLPGFQKLRNIAESEYLLQQAQQRASESYRNLMGEVESRNVEHRIDFNQRNRLYLSPEFTESVPRSQQINQ